MNSSPNKMIKIALHPRNRHRNGYDFVKLMQCLPELVNYVKQNQYGQLSIDFADPIAVKTLNKALLICFYQLHFWDIPNDFLCPPVPGRVDYIHYLADLLASDNHSNIPQGKHIRVLDIGVGANAIYPIVGHAEYGWSFVGSDVNPTAIKIATMIATSNSGLKSALHCRLQRHQNAIFSQIIKPNEQYALTICNPPFYRSLEEANANTTKKISNLQKSKPIEKQPVRNFGGHSTELWCEGGEATFISNMITESQSYQSQCVWFSSLVSKKETLAVLSEKLKNVAALDVKIIPMAQGQKVSRFIAWTFLTSEQRQHFFEQLKH
ncbi:23S rRNA (adenine(1618)-N(6))-methyltransferase RlmF [Orbus sasakiae]|uniref:Ribosomal RNA large subunit methyltransferase F n=1 Tax=Orbus sasakiae TaxID=1078475 RepID=A0ABP9N744_9GAMM